MVGNSASGQGGGLNNDGTATIYSATSTVSGSGDQGADPDQVMEITDQLGATTPGSESFRTIDGPQNRVVYRGVAVVPGEGQLTLAVV